MRTHLTGVLLHTKSPHGKFAYSFVDLLQYPHDSNLTITVIVEVLAKYSKEHGLPPTLYIQMDNTSRENKNKYVLGFSALLVQFGIFDKVYYEVLFCYSCIFDIIFIKVQLNFLPVGHTHEDIDQMFSRVAREIKKSGAESLPGLTSCTITNVLQLIVV